MSPHVRPLLVALALALTVAGCGSRPEPDLGPAPYVASAAADARASTASSSPTASPEDLRSRLTPMQYRVTQECGTEPAFDNEFWAHKEPGLYVDVVSGEPLFASVDKYDSGSGWPSFTRPLSDDVVEFREDSSHGMVRTEVRSRTGSHLGHVFADGPQPTGERFCINSASLRFVPLAELPAAGLGRYVALFPEEQRIAAGLAGETTMTSGSSTKTATAILAGGCFWGMEDILRALPGVIDTEVGYTGGELAKPTYDDVKTGRTGHAEAIRIVFDPERLAYAALLDTFFRMHDPTTPNRQGNDVGSQYRSAIFFTNAEQEREARAAIARASESGRWKRPIVTEVTPATTFWPAEDWHQDYLEKHPGGYTCHFLRD